MKLTGSIKSNCYKQMFTVTSAALLAGTTLFAQTSAGSPQPNNGAMGNNPNSSMNAQAAVQNPAVSGMTNAGSASMQDKTFAKKALAGGMAEVQLGQLAQQKSNSEDVKKFGQQMVDDHTKLNDQMKPIAVAVGVQPPADLMLKDKQLMSKLQGLSGDDFDKAYIKAMLKDHKQDDKEFQMEASSGQNQQEKDAATQGDQVIKQHLQMVQELAKTHNVTAGGSKSSM